MKITALIENVSNTDGINAEHGLSLFIETEEHNILFDKILVLNYPRFLSVRIYGTNLICQTLSDKSKPTDKHDSYQYPYYFHVSNNLPL